MNPPLPVFSERMKRQLAFLIEIDKLKSVLRRSYLVHEDRRENSAEHSWHLAMLTLVLSEYANEAVDMNCVIRMLLVHDLVEIDAGDTSCYDDEGLRDKVERERHAADRLFGLLPPDQGRAFRLLWEEFEAGQSPEAKFARAVDRMMPILHEYLTRGRTWQAHGIDRRQVVAKNAIIEEGAQDLWHVVESVIEEAVARGYLSEKQATLQGE